jgi:murein DD-endopeptidase MepM/ murein hydrolase activator NlpD
MRSYTLDLLCGALCAVTLLFCFSFFLDGPPDASTAATPAPPPAIERDAYGVPQNTFQVTDRTVRRNETFSDLLAGYDLATPIQALAETARPVFDVRYLRPGKPLRIYHDTTNAARLVVYEPDPTQYVVFDLRDSVAVYTRERPVTTRQRTVHGVITSSPYETLVDQGADPALAVELSEVFAWQVDFYRIQRGDAFSVIYDERLVDGKPVGLGAIRAARFRHQQKDYYAFRFAQDELVDYYDENGESLRLAFLRAPLKYSRISSRYTKRRFHPVLKRYKAHLGTDYAAPTGTPIRATGDGTVVAASYTRGNGNYVKIRHNGTYTTGYLHMSKIATGIRRGAPVEQGQVIGYVGSTGLATGPHLCYRFWKNGRQVDPYRQDLPSAEPIAPIHRPAFDQVKTTYLPLLNSADSPFAPQVVALPPDLDQALTPRS